MSDRQKKVLELLDRSGGHLHGLLGRLTLSRDAAGDLIQELFIRLCKSNGLERARDPFAYARRVAINLAFEWRRKRKISFQLLDEEALPGEDGLSALENMVRAEQLEQILEATGQLSALAREVVVMRYIEEESYEVIAGRLGKKPKYMRALCAKALAQLRRLLAEEKSCPGEKV